MDWDTYKAICDSPDVGSRWLLEQTLELVERTELAAPLRRCLQASPVEKPADHQGGPETDMFRMALTLDEVRAIRERVEAAAAAGIETTGTRGRGLGGFVETWCEYERSLERSAGTARP